MLLCLSTEEKPEKKESFEILLGNKTWQKIFLFTWAAAICKIAQDHGRRSETKNTLKYFFWIPYNVIDKNPVKCNCDRKAIKINFFLIVQIL